MPIASGIYIIANVQHRNPVLLENPNDEESIRGHYKPENASERIQGQWHWRVVDLKNGSHLIQNVEHKRYANCGSRADLDASVMGASDEQQWNIRAISGKGEYTIGAIDSPIFWMLPDKEKGTPVGLFNISTDRKCWWTFTNVETGATVKEGGYGAYLFALNPLPILPFSPLRLDFVVIQQMPDDSVSTASRTIAGVCSQLVSLRRVQSDAVCVNIIEVMAIESDIFFERSSDVVTFENLRNLEGSGIPWEECGGASLLPPTAMRGLRANTTKIAILNFSETLFQRGGHAITELINGLAEHDITLILTPIQPTWEDTFSKSVVFKELKELASEYRRFSQESQFSDYFVNYNKTVAPTRLRRHPEIRDKIRQNIPHIIEVLKENDQNTRSAAVTAFSELSEYAELREAILQTVPKIIEMLKGNEGEAEAAASALIKLAEHPQLRDVLNTKDKEGNTPLLRAAMQGHDAVVALFLAYPGVDINAKGKNDVKLLSWAASNGNGEVARLLLAHGGVEVHTKDIHGYTPLATAALHGHEAVVHLLLAYPGVDINAKNKDGSTPLSCAASQGREVVVRLLLAHPDIEADAKNNRGWTPLSFAAMCGQEAVCRPLLAHPSVDVNSKDKNGMTRLSWAASSGRDAVVRLFLAHPDIDVNTKDNNERTALISAVIRGQDAIVRLLLDRPDVDVNAKDESGDTSLLSAVALNHDVIVGLLLAHPDIDVNSKGKHDKTPLSCAVTSGQDAVVRLLLGHPDVDVNVKDDTGSTMLLRAAHNGQEAVIRLLLAHEDIDLNAKDTFGATALSDATYRKHEAVVRLLQEKIQQAGQ